MSNFKFGEAFEDFVTQRMDYLGSNASAAVSDAITQTEACLGRLAATLSEEQKPLWQELENALSAQAGEETRYYYRSGFSDALRFIFKAMDIDFPEGGVKDEVPRRRIKMHDFQNTAFFVRHPFRIEDLRTPHLYEQRRPFVVEKVIVLAKIDYENLITDLCVGRWYIKENKRLCYIDKDGVWHCLLVRRRGQPDGVLVMPDGADYPKFAAYYPGNA